MFNENTTTLKSIRLRTGMSIEEIAPLFYYEPAHWRKIEAGNYTITIQQLHLIYDVCHLKGYFKDEEKTPIPKVKDKALAKAIFRLSELEPLFSAAFSADDYKECREILDVQHQRFRISDDEYTLILDYINYLDV